MRFDFDFTKLLIMLRKIVRNAESQTSEIRAQSLFEEVQFYECKTIYVYGQLIYKAIPTITTHYSNILYIQVSVYQKCHCSLAIADLLFKR